MATLKELLKSDRRRQWTSLKSKHGKAIAAKKLDFDAKLGSLLDKQHVQVAAVDKLFSRQAGGAADLQKVVAATRPVREIARYYRDKVKGLGDPAEKALVAFLKDIEGDCVDWERALDVISSQAVVAKNSPAQMKAVREVYGTLDALNRELANLARSLPDLRSRAKKIPREAKYAAYTKLAKKAVTEKAWQKDLDADMKITESHAATLEALVATNDKLLNRLLTASVKFNETSDYPAFKQLAASFSSSSALKDFKQRAIVLDDWLKKGIFAREDTPSAGMSVGGADAKDLRRVSLTVGPAGRLLVDPIVNSIRKLP